MSDERSRQFIILMSKQEREMLNELAQQRGVSSAAYIRWILYAAAEEAGIISPPKQVKKDAELAVA